jgi:drug/metabolite transporter (DMT)-like permease
VQPSDNPHQPGGLLIGWKSVFITAVPAIFVLLWASGFIAAKVVVRHADVLTLLTLRYVLVALLMTGVALLMRAPWPQTWNEVGHAAVAGLMMQVMYFAGCWLAMDMGVGAGVLALIVCMQPIFTAAVVGPLLGERVSRNQWLGLLLGLAGVFLVISNNLGMGLGTLTGIAWSVIGLIGITAGTLYQKKYCSNMDIRTGGAIQFITSVLVFFPLALIFDDGQIDWNAEFLVSLSYVVIVSSLISLSLLAFMIKRGKASRVASLFFLVPPCALLFSWGLLDEPINMVSLSGMALAVMGVAIVLRQKSRK